MVLTKNGKCAKSLTKSIPSCIGLIKSQDIVTAISCASDVLEAVRDCSGALQRSTTSITQFHQEEKPVLFYRLSPRTPQTFIPIPHFGLESKENTASCAECGKRRVRNSILPLVCDNCAYPP